MQAHSRNSWGSESSKGKDKGTRAAHVTRPKGTQEFLEPIPPLGIPHWAPRDQQGMPRPLGLGCSVTGRHWDQQDGCTPSCRCTSIMLFPGEVRAESPVTGPPPSQCHSDCEPRGQQPPSSRSHMRPREEPHLTEGHRTVDYTKPRAAGSSPSSTSHSKVFLDQTAAPHPHSVLSLHKTGDLGGQAGRGYHRVCAEVACQLTVPPGPSSLTTQQTGCSHGDAAAGRPAALTVVPTQGHAGNHTPDFQKANQPKSNLE